MSEQQDRVFAELLLLLDNASDALGGDKTVIEGINEWLYTRMGSKWQIRCLQEPRRKGK